MFVKEFVLAGEIHKYRGDGFTEVGPKGH